MSGEIKELVSLIDTRGLECLNEQTDHPIKNAIEDVSRFELCFRCTDQPTNQKE